MNPAIDPRTCEGCVLLSTGICILDIDDRTHVPHGCSLKAISLSCVLEHFVANEVINNALQDAYLYACAADYTTDIDRGWLRCVAHIKKQLGLQ